MRLQTSLSKSFWGDAIIFSYFFVNRSPHHKLNGGIPEKVWSGKKVEPDHLRIFSCSSYAHVEATERNKLIPKS